MQQEITENELRQQLPLELAIRLEGTSPQFGKTAFMKMAYLLQELYEVPLGYRFSLYTYGPYSAEVLADLEYAKLRKRVEVEYWGIHKVDSRSRPVRLQANQIGKMSQSPIIVNS